VRMTPFEVSLEREIEMEQLRFANEWLFPWHNLRNSINVDRFDGGRIRLGGIRFGDQQQSIFWQAIGRYLVGKVHSIFRRWDEETKDYSVEHRRTSLEGTYRMMKVLMAGAIRRGIKTDQALRGGGYPKSDTPHQVTPVQSRVQSEIERLRAAHAGMILKVASKRTSVWRIFWDSVNLRPGIFGFTVDLKKLVASSNEARRAD
jgi:hypothetical protein